MSKPNAIEFFSDELLDRETGEKTSGNAPESLVNKFHIPAAHYLKVPMEYLDLVIEILQMRNYVYKTAPRSNYVAIAVQYQRG